MKLEIPVSCLFTICLVSKQNKKPSNITSKYFPFPSSLFIFYRQLDNKKKLLASSVCGRDPVPDGDWFSFPVAAGA